MMSMGMVMWPKVSWFQRARREFLMFPNGKHDDFVDAASWLGMGVHRMINTVKKIEVESVAPVGFNITPRILRDTEKREKRKASLAFTDR
jgi:phage terminase large subunit-like protein